jgi:hypothetical protein
LNGSRKTLRGFIRHHFPAWNETLFGRAKARITLPELSDEVNTTLTAIMRNANLWHH